MKTTEDRILALVTPSTRHRGPESLLRIRVTGLFYRLARPLRGWLCRRAVSRAYEAHPPMAELRPRSR